MFSPSWEGSDMLILSIGVDVSYGLLAVLEFSSVRRRMSVVVRTPDGKIKLLSKGADLVMFDRMMDGDRKYVDYVAIIGCKLIFSQC